MENRDIGTSIARTSEPRVSRVYSRNGGPGIDWGTSNGSRGKYLYNLRSRVQQNIVTAGAEQATVKRNSTILNGPTYEQCRTQRGGRGDRYRLECIQTLKKYCFLSQS